MMNTKKKAAGRRNKVFFNKGRQVDYSALNEARDLLNKYIPLKKHILTV